MNHLPPVSDEALLDLLKQGDNDAFTQLYERYWYPLYQTAFSRLKDRAAAEELVQELFVELWERRDSLQIGKLEHYLFRAIRYAVIDYVRRQLSQHRYLEYYQAYLALSAESEETGPSDAAQSHLKKGIELLPEKTREIFILNRLKGWPVPRIARHFDLSEKAIEYHLTKSLKTLRVYLKDLIYFGSFFLVESLAGSPFPTALPEFSKIFW